MYQPKVNKIKKENIKALIETLKKLNRDLDQRYYHKNQPEGIVFQTVEDINNSINGTTGLEGLISLTPKFKEDGGYQDRYGVPFIKDELGELQTGIKAAIYWLGIPFQLHKDLFDRFVVGLPSDKNSIISKLEEFLK